MSKGIRAFLIFLILLTITVVGWARVPKGDLINYEGTFDLIYREGFEFFSKMLLFQKAEFLYYLINYILSLFTDDFKFFQGLICLASAYMVSTVRSKTSLIGLLIFLLFPLFFSISLQLVRQWLSMSMLIYGVLNRDENKSYFIYIAPFIHVTSWFYVLVYVLNRLNIKIVIFLFPFSLLLLYLGVLDYLELRFSKGSYYSLEYAGMTPLYVGCLFVFLLLILRANKQILILALSTLLLMVFAPNGEIRFRFMYFFILLLPYIFQRIYDRLGLLIQRGLLQSFYAFIFLLLAIWQSYYFLEGPYSYGL